MDPAQAAYEEAKRQMEAFEAAQKDMMEAVEAAKAEKSGDFITPAMFVLRQKFGAMTDREQARIFMALGMAAAQTYLLFYTDTVETLAGEAGEITLRFYI